jgi:hypothetical protein
MDKTIMENEVEKVADETTILEKEVEKLADEEAIVEKEVEKVTAEKDTQHPVVEEDDSEAQDETSEVPDVKAAGDHAADIGTKLEDLKIEATKEELKMEEPVKTGAEIEDAKVVEACP